MDKKVGIIISAEDRTRGAFGSVASGLDGLAGKASAIGSALGGITAAAGVGIFAGMIKSAIDAADTLDELKEKTGASVENLSKMKAVADVTDTSMESVAGGLNKLTKSMTTALDAQSDAAKLFEAMGISVVDNAGRLRDSGDVFIDLAGKMQEVNNSSERVAAAQVLLGKSGADLLPFMKDLATFGGAAARTTDEQAAAAADLNDNIKRLSLTFRTWVNDIAMDVVPAAGALVETLLEARSEIAEVAGATGDMARDHAIRDWALDGVRAVGFVVDEFRLLGKVAVEILTPIERLAKNITNVGAIAGIAFSGSSLGEKRDAYAKLEAESRDYYRSLDQRLSDNRADSPLFSDRLEARIAALKTTTAAVEKGGRDLSDTLSRIQTAGKKGVEDLAAIHADLLAAMHKSASQELADLAKQAEDYAKAYAALLDPIEEHARSLEAEVRNYGLSEAAIQSSIVARLEEARAIAAVNGASADHLDYLDREIAARRRIATAASQKDVLDANRQAAEESAKAWENYSRDIEQSLTDALYRSFEAGNDFGKTFAQTLQNTFRAMILKVAVQAVVQPVMSGIGSSLGIAVPSSGSAGGLFSLAGSANNAYNLFSGGAGVFGSAAAYGAAVPGLSMGSAQAALLASQTAEFGAAGLSATAAAGGMGAAGSALVAAMPYLGLALAAAGLLGGIGDNTDAPQSGGNQAYYLGGSAFGAAQVRDRELSGGMSDAVKESFKMLSQGLADMLKGLGAGSADMTTYWYHMINNEGKAGTFTARLFGANPYNVPRDQQDLLYEYKAKLAKGGANFADELAKSYVGMAKAAIAASDLGAGTKDLATYLLDAGTSVQSLADSFGSVKQWVDSLEDLNATADDGVIKLIKLAGGIEQFQGLTQAYVTGFYSEQEQIAMAVESLRARFSDLGVAMPASAAGFRALVAGIDTTTEAGSALFVELLGLSGAFKSVSDAAAAADAQVAETQAGQIAKYVAAQQAAQQAAAQANIAAAQESAAAAREIATTFQGIVESLESWRRSLSVGDLAVGSPASRAAEAQRQYAAIAARAKLGDREAAGQYQAAADTYLRTLLETVGDPRVYAQAFGSVMGDSDQVVAVAGRQASLAEEQVRLAEAQLTTLQAIAAGLGKTGAASQDLPLVVADFAQAAKDWQAWFDITAIGSSQTFDIGTTTRLSKEKGLFTDSAGRSYVFSAQAGPYGLAEQSSVWAAEMRRRYGQWTGPAYAEGTPWVPADGLAMLHAGERVIPQVDNVRMMAALSDWSDVAGEVRALRDEVVALRQISESGHAAVSANTARMSRALDRVMPDGDALKVRVAA